MAICAPTGIHVTTAGSASQSIYGVLAGPFKLNHAAAVFRRRRASKVLHLTNAKPRIASVIADFEIVTENSNVPASGFHYQSHDQYLEVINLSAIGGSITRDAVGPIREYGISTEYVEIPTERNVFTTFHEDKTPI